MLGSPFLILPHTIHPASLKGKYDHPISHMRKPKLRGSTVCLWSETSQQPIQAWDRYPSIWPRSLCSFSSNTMCFAHSGNYINISWVIATNLEVRSKLWNSSELFLQDSWGPRMLGSCARRLSHQMCRRRWHQTLSPEHQREPWNTYGQEIEFHASIKFMFFRTASLGEGPWLPLSHLEIDTE